MKLVHYSNAPVRLEDLKRLEQSELNGQYFKPRGLWVSDDDEEWNWRTWCEEEDFRLDHLTHANEVILVPDPNVLILNSATDIDRFSAEFATFGEGELPEIVRITLRTTLFLNWPRVMQRWNGIIITPYIVARRLASECMWYYGWDCASGCLWEPSAIASITLQEVLI